MSNALKVYRVEKSRPPAAGGSVKSEDSEASGLPAAVDLARLRRDLAGISRGALSGLLRGLLRDPALPESDMQGLRAVWEAWLTQLCIVCDAAVLSVSLPVEVEEVVDAAWRDSPLRGILLDATAKILLMQAVAALLPETAVAGCAPVPVLSSAQEQAFCAAALLHPRTGLPARRYAVLTYFPYRGGCSVCAMQKTCGHDGAPGPYSR